MKDRARDDGKTNADKLRQAIDEVVKTATEARFTGTLTLEVDFVQGGAARLRKIVTKEPVF